jgi:hypothetical protein
LPVFASFALLGRAAPSAANGEPHAPAALASPKDTSRRIELYSPRLRRSSVMYLRLRLLELREEGLERARAVIEHRLSIDELLGEPARLPPADASRARPQTPAAQKATAHARRSVKP